MKTLISFFALFLCTVGLFGDNRLEKKDRFFLGQLNKNLREARISYPGSLIQYRSWLELSLQLARRNIHRDRFVEISGLQPGQKGVNETAPGLVSAPEAVHRRSIQVAALYELDDSFRDINRVFAYRGNIYFLQGDVQLKGKGMFNVISRLNREKWYDFVNGTRFDDITVFGSENLLGFQLKSPDRVYRFTMDFEPPIPVEIRDYQFRQEIFKLDDHHFACHNFRFSGAQAAVDIFDVSGVKRAEIFRYGSSRFLKPGNEYLILQTVTDSDGKGRLSVAFLYPQNPYRIWIYTSTGKQVMVLGHFFTGGESYLGPDEWFMNDLESLKADGMGKLCVIHKLAFDGDGRLLVFWSSNTIPPPFREGGDSKMYMDVFSGEGSFLGRAEFPLGFPEYVGRDQLIYSKMECRPGFWKLVVSRYTLR